MRQRPPVPRGCHFTPAVTIRWVKPEEGTARARGEPGAGAAPAVGQRCPGEGGAAAGAGEKLRLPHRAGSRGAVDPARSQEARRVRPSVHGTALGLWLHLETLQAPWSLQGPRAEGREAGVRWFSLPSTLALNTCSGGELAGPHGPPTCPPRGAACVPPAAWGPGVPLGGCCLRRRRPRSSDRREEAANTPGRAAALGAPAAPRRLLRRRGFLSARGGLSPRCA